MSLRRVVGVMACFAGVAFCGLSQAQTPVSLAIHGPSSVYEASSAEFRTVVTWSDGTKSGVPASWTSSNPGLAPVFPFGSSTSLLVGAVGANSTVTVGATYFHATGSLSASKVVTILDASSYPVVGHSLVRGWNLLGNSIGAPINVVEVFGNPLQPVAGITGSVMSVWKWDGANGKWAYFSPALTPTQLAEKALANGYSVLQVVHPGEGYWVHAKQPLTLPARAAASISIGTNSIVNGWNLLATGQALTPGALNAAVSGGYVSLWSWDAATAKWLYYAPSLEASGGLKAFTDAQGYLDFATLGRQLGHGIGFWVHSGTLNANSDLDPLGQAKAMFSELRTTVRAYTNDLKSGFLDAQSTRFGNEMVGKVGPDMSWALQYADLLTRATRLFEDIRNGNASTYQVQAGTGGTVRASRMVFFGSELYLCTSNDMAGTLVTPSLLTAVYCAWEDFNFDAYDYAFPSRTKMVQEVSVTAGATSNDFNYGASNWRVVEVWNGSYYQLASRSQIGATRTGAFSRTYLGTTTNISSFSFSGDLPPRNPLADRDTVNLTATRAVQNAGNNIYRYNVAGSVASRDAGGAPMVTVSLVSGSYYDAKENSDGNPLPGSLQAAHVVGTAQTAATRFTGTIDLGAFAADADNAEYLPASSVFDGFFEDLSAGGAGTFLTGRFTVTLNNLPLYHSLQPESAGNFLSFDTSFVGTIQAPSRPEMRLTVGSLRASLDSYAITANYTYGPVSVTGIGTLDTFNTDNSTLTITNQNGVTVTFQPHADAVVSKGGVTLGIIPFGSVIVYFSDGYFESL